MPELENENTSEVVDNSDEPDAFTSQEGHRTVSPGTYMPVELPPLSSLKLTPVDDLPDYWVQPDGWDKPDPDDKSITVTVRTNTSTRTEVFTLDSTDPNRAAESIMDFIEELKAGDDETLRHTNLAAYRAKHGLNNE